MASLDHGPSTVADVYRFDTTHYSTLLISVNTAGNGPGSADSGVATISNDGNYVAFESLASNLATNTTKSDETFEQVFFRNITAGRTTLLSVGTSNVTGAADSLAPIFSQDGSRLAFKSSVDDLVSNDTNSTEDIFTTITPGHDFATLNGGALSLRGSSLGDAITLTLKKGQIYATRNGATLKFSKSAVTSIAIDAADGPDVVTIGNGVGNSYVLGGSGNDKITGGDGNDNLLGAAGVDSIYAGAGNDRVDGGKGNDLIYGGDGDDRLYGSENNDHLFGEGGVDRLTGGAGKDTLDGGSSDDKFYANDGEVDFLFGGKGSDLASVDV